MSVVLFTNCQGKFIYENYLQSLDFFKTRGYTYIQNYGIHSIDKKVISECDVFIYQPVKNYTIDVSQEDSLLSLLKPTCIKVCFPSIYIDIWPIYEQTGFYCGGHIIDQYKAKGKDLDQILTMYDEGSICFDMKNRFETAIRYMKTKEDQYCNINITEFIKDNYQKYRLFDTQNHPTGIVASYVAKEICKIINTPFPDIDIFNQGHVHVISLQWPDSIYMKKELGLEISNDDTTHYRNLIIYLYNNPHLVKPLHV